jgi:dipeptidyl aminopeptidase/acylaminoacyl peptidase
MVRTTDERLILREEVTGGPTKINPSLCPDGSHIVYFKPDANNVMNGFVRKLTPGGNPKDDKDDFQITFEEGSGVGTKDMGGGRASRNREGPAAIRWLPDSKRFLYRKDKDGNQLYRLFMGDITKPLEKPRDLTPFEGARVYEFYVNPRFPSHIKVALPLRDPECPFPDIYKIDLETFELTMDTENPGRCIVFEVDDETFEVTLACVKNPDQSLTYHVRDEFAKSAWRPFFSIPMGQEEDTAVLGHTKDRKGVYIVSRKDRDTTALVKVDAQTAEELEELAHDPGCDLNGVRYDEVTREIVSLEWCYARLKRVYLREGLSEHHDLIASQGPENCDVIPAGETADQRTWVFQYLRDDGPSEWCLYKLDTKEIIPLFVTNPELNKYKLAHMDCVMVPARDGTELVGYLVRADTEEPTPLIITPHGGPWNRSYWGYDGFNQCMANRGYATMSVNFRGGTGYGNKFLEAGYGQWGVGLMQNDLTDAVEWAIKQGIALRDKVAIVGHSYGGYAALAGLCFTPDLYACAVCNCPISNIKTLLDSLPPFLSHKRDGYIIKIGDVDNDAELNKKISPLFHVDAIERPLLISHGANDPVTSRRESDQIAESMHRKGIAVEYILYPDEGHGLGRPANTIDWFARMEQFFAKHLGGRAAEFVRHADTSATLPLEAQKEEAVPEPKTVVT